MRAPNGRPRRGQTDAGMAEREALAAEARKVTAAAWRADARRPRCPPAIAAVVALPEGLQRSRTIEAAAKWAAGQQGQPSTTIEAALCERYGLSPAETCHTPVDVVSGACLRRPMAYIVRSSTNHERTMK